MLWVEVVLLKTTILFLGRLRKIYKKQANRWAICLFYIDLYR